MKLRGGVHGFSHREKPLFVVVGLHCCSAGRVLTDSTLKPIAKAGELYDVSFVLVNHDRLNLECLLPSCLRVTR